MSDILGEVQAQGEVRLFCAARVGVLRVGSHLLDEFSVFSRFLLWALSHGYSRQAIEDVVDLGPHALDDELDYLVNIGFLEDTYALTPTAREWHSFFEKIEAINERAHKIILNTYTGEVEEYSEDKLAFGEYRNYSLFSNKYLQAPRLLKYAPACEYAKDSCPLGDGVKKEFVESIHANIEFYDEAPMGYIEYRYSPEHPDEDSQPLVDFIYKSQRYEVFFIDRHLDGFRDLKDKLLEIYHRDAELLSKKSHELLSMFTFEEALQKKFSVISCDPFRALPGRWALLDDEDERAAPELMVVMEDFEKVSGTVLATLPGSFSLGASFPRAQRFGVSLPFSHFKRVDAHGKP